MSKNQIVIGFDHNKDILEKDIKSSLEKMNWRGDFKSDTKVFIKPNFTLPFFKPGVTTNEHVIEATINVLKDRVNQVYVGEADGGSCSFKAQYSLEQHGIPEMCKRTGAEMINLSTTKRTIVSDKVNGKNIKVTVPKVLLNIDQTISMPVLKVHVVVTTSLSIKNMWGIHPDEMRMLDRKHLPEKLSLISKKINLNYSIVDGIYGLNVRGPMDGQVVNVNGIFVGNNPVGTDSALTRLMGFDPKKIRYLKVAEKYGLGSMKDDDIIKYNLDKYQQSFIVRPTLVDYLGKITFHSYILTKVIFDSSLTNVIYKIVGRVPKRKIKVPGDEI